MQVQSTRGVASCVQKRCTVHGRAVCSLPRPATTVTECSYAAAFTSFLQLGALSAGFARPVGAGLGRRRGVIKCYAQLVEASPGKTVLGFIGIGIMGLAMTRNLIKAGYEVVVWNRNSAKCDPLVSEGAKLGASPKDVVARATYTFAMLADPQAALEVVAGPNGVAAGMQPGKGYVDVSTVDANTSQAVAQAVRAAGGLYLEAPVSGSKAPAEQGKLIFLTGGDEALYSAVCPALDVMGKARFFLGPEGSGANMKLVVNMIMGSMMASFAEGLALAEKAGLRPSDVVEVSGLGAIACPMFALKGPAMVAGNFPPAFPLKHQQKDLRLALELGQQVNQALPVAQAAQSEYTQALADGLGDLDFAAVIKVVKASASQEHHA